MGRYPLHEPKSVGGRALLAELDRRGLTRSDAARVLGIDRARMSKIVAGQAGPSLREAVRIEQLYDVRPRLWLESL